MFVPCFDMPHNLEFGVVSDGQSEINEQHSFQQDSLFSSFFWTDRYCNNIIHYDLL